MFNMPSGSSPVIQPSSRRSDAQPALGDPPGVVHRVMTAPSGGRRWFVASLMAGVAACASAASPAPTAASVRAAGSGAITRAGFDAQNHALVPSGWREWVYVGTPLTPNALNGGTAAFPEFHNVYVEPSAFASYMKTGTWAQGTQIVKELVLVRKNDNKPDGSSEESSGRGYFQGEFHGLELLVKDQERFGKEPGGWAFFSFGHKPEPYDATATVLPASACSGCHEGNADSDFIFTQYYPMLRARAAKRTM
jgi:Cytochrome P460